MAAPASPLSTRRLVPATAVLALALASPAAWAENGEEKDKAKANGSGAPASAEKGSAKSGDPAGNNGTIKIDGVPLDDGKGNEPHVGCAFAVKFFNFDDGQTADITFTGKPPTGPDGVLLAQKAVRISDDPAGGGKDADAVLTYTAAQLGLTGAAPHKNGWHVKVEVDALEAPGGAKKKVFWIDCDTPPAAAPQSGADAGAAGAAGTSSAGTSRQSTGAAQTGSAAAPRSGTGSVSAAETGSAVAGAFGEVSVSGARVGTATSASSNRGLRGALPNTGAEVAALVAVALAALGIGGASIVAGRRKRTLLAD